MRGTALLRSRQGRWRAAVHTTAAGALLGLLISLTAGQISGTLFTIWTAALGLTAVGMEAVFATRGKVQTASDNHEVWRTLPPIEQLVADSERVELLGSTMTALTERAVTIRALHDAHRGGIPVRLLLMAPDAPGIALVSTDRAARGTAARPDDKRRLIERSVTRLLAEFGEDELAKVLRLYPSTPHSSVYRFGSRYVITVYTFGRGGSSPALSLSSADHGDFCGALDRGFEELWTASTTIRLDRQIIASLAVDHGVA